MEADDVWQELYKAAVLETDDKKLHKRLRAAKAAIDVQLHELQSDHDGGTPDERQAISDALAVLNVAKRAFCFGQYDRRQDWRCNCIQKLIAADP